MNNFSLTHIVRKPLRASEGPAPLLILLHGVGSNEQDLMGLAPSLDERFFIVSVRAPITRSPGSYAWFPVQFAPTGFIIEPEAAERSRQLILKLVDELVEAYPVDPKRVFLMGFSQGCIMSLYCALTEPEKFAGVVGMSGRLLPELLPKMASPERLKDFPLLIVHGTEDTVIPISYGREIRDKLRQLPVKLEYKEYAMVHQVSAESLADVQRWLAERLDTK